MKILENFLKPLMEESYNKQVTLTKKFFTDEENQTILKNLQKEKSYHLQTYSEMPGQLITINFPFLLTYFHHKNKKATTKFSKFFAYSGSLFWLGCVSYYLNKKSEKRWKEFEVDCVFDKNWSEFQRIRCFYQSDLEMKLFAKKTGISYADFNFKRSTESDKILMRAKFLSAIGQSAREPLFW